MRYACRSFVATFFLVSIFHAAAATPDAPVAKRIFAASDGTNLLTRNGWQPYQKGFERTDGAWLCDNGSDEKAHRGVVQTVVLDQKTPTPIIATAWSRAEGVAGSSDADYSLYLDLTYGDGSHLWGQTTAFSVGTHDWQQRRATILPQKPVKSAAFYLIFRNHGGKAWFRQPSLCEIKPTAGLHLFDGSTIEMAGDSLAGFQLRDVAADSDILRVGKNPIPADSANNEASAGFQAKSLGLNLSWRETKSATATFYDVTLTSGTSEKDRAATLYFVVPVKGENLQWLCGPRKPIAVEPNREYSEAVSLPVGVGRLSRYPLAAVSDGSRGESIGIDMEHPAVYRVGYHSGTRELFLAYDIGLTREKPSAHVRFCRFTFDPAWGFRSALQQYYELFPEQFRCRVARQGLWMPFAPISKVKDRQDFGFRFKEGNDETKWDDEHGILTFRYTEPMTWWMSMAKEAPHTFEAALAQAKQQAAGGNQEAKALLASGMHDASGRLAAKMLDTPWCNGAVWSMNSMPGIRGETTDFKNKWNDAIRKSLYGPKRNGDLDGEYIDSSEGYVTEELDFRRDHFAAADTPLTFSRDGAKPGIFRGLVTFEYIRGLAVDVHKMNKLMMGNATPTQLCWLAPLLDVMGTETDWNYAGQWRPMSDAELFYRRALCKGKPYCLLMNTKFDRFSHELVERYMQRSLAYGMFPGFFSEDASTGQYFARPELYERDRPLFKKYVPLCKLVAEAGWNPVTGARSSDECIHLERFGRYLTVFNDSQQQRTATIALDSRSSASSRELVGGANISWNDGKTSLTLDGEGVAVMELP